VAFQTCGAEARHGTHTRLCTSMGCVCAAVCQSLPVIPGFSSIYVTFMKDLSHCVSIMKVM